MIGGEVRAVDDGVASAKLEAIQGDARLIRNGLAEVRTGWVRTRRS